MAQIQHALCLAFPVWHPLNNPPCEIPSFTSSFINSNIVIETKLKVHFSFLFLFLFFSGMIGKYFSSPRIICLRSPCCVRGASGKRSRGQLRVLYDCDLSIRFMGQIMRYYLHISSRTPSVSMELFFYPPPMKYDWLLLDLVVVGDIGGSSLGIHFPPSKVSPKHFHLIRSENNTRLNMFSFIIIWT